MRLHRWFQTRAAEVPCEVGGGEQSVEVQPRVRGTEAGPGFGADEVSAGQREVEVCVGNVETPRGSQAEGVGTVLSKGTANKGQA